MFGTSVRARWSSSTAQCGPRVSRPRTGGSGFRRTKSMYVSGYRQKSTTNAKTNGSNKSNSRYFSVGHSVDAVVGATRSKKKQMVVGFGMDDKFKMSKKRYFANSSSNSGAVTKLYEAKIQQGKIQDDAAQRNAIKSLDALYDQVLAFEKVREPMVKSFEEKWKQAHQEAKDAKEAAENSWMKSLFGSKEKDKEEQDGLEINVPRVEAPRGIYLHGGPGSGKTFSMELFHEVLPIEGKRRIHFDEFMLNVHRRLHDLQQRGYRSDEMINRCVQGLYHEGWVLCFDEFQVTDVANAMVLKRLFDALLDRGMVVVITSNREPDDLYKNGIQRDLFVPFIEDIKRLFHVVKVESETDYRMIEISKIAAGAAKLAETEDLQDEGSSSGTSGTDSKDQPSSVYFVSTQGVGQTAKFERLFEKWVKGDVVYDSKLSVQGRQVNVPRAGRRDDVARFTFDDLCGQPLGAADYFAIGATFHTVFLEDVPQMKLSTINQVRRFITLVDNLYDQKVVLVISAQVPMDQLLDKGDLKSEDDVEAAADMIQEVDIIGDATYVPSRSNIDEIFAFDRTISRLHEMGRKDYLLAKRSSDTPSPVRFLSQLEASDLSDGDIKMLFERYDKNSDGVIDKAELKILLEEVTLFRSGHRHVPEEVFEETKKALTRSDSKVIEWESFSKYFKQYGLTMRG